MAGEGGDASAEFLLQSLLKLECTVALLFPYQLHDICKYAEKHAVNFGKLHCTMWGGSMMTETDWKRCLDIFPDLLSMYGSTESVVADQARGRNSYEEKLGNTGYPSTPNEVKIADEKGNAVPIGQIGEICVRSYRTAELRYIGQDIRSSMFEGGWFRMGDYGKVDVKGRIVVIGRRHDTIARATIKIYPSAIERVIADHEKVSLVKVVGVPDDRLGERVCACVVAKAGSDLTTNELEMFCNEAFITKGSSDGLGIKPDFIVILKSLPLIPSSIGKYDVQKIKELAIAAIGC